MMNVDLFAQKIQDINWRLAKLYQGANATAQPHAEQLLPVAFKELGTASEELQVAVEELFQQNEELVATRALVEMESQRYKELFEFMPDAYLVTDAQGRILEANRAASTLLNVPPTFLLEKALLIFIPPQERRAFRSKLIRLQQSDWVQEWTVRLQPRNSDAFEASLAVASVRDSQGHLVSLRWVMHDITERRRALRALRNSDYDPRRDRPVHFYSKGETIPLEPSSLWLVCQGLVKLTTMNETANEVLIGFAGPSMPFGSGMTSLPTYQATVLSENAQLVSVPLSEIATSPHLTQALLPKISDRLRQTESLLAIAGKRQVKERLYHLLTFLEREIGQPVAQGTRLSVRLTHQDLADACCTTRVTITRLLGKLQKQGKVAFDSKNHIVIKEAEFHVENAS